VRPGRKIGTRQAARRERAIMARVGLARRGGRAGAAAAAGKLVVKFTIIIIAIVVIIVVAVVEEDILRTVNIVYRPGVGPKVDLCT
jgi:hypothetical protein